MERGRDAGPLDQAGYPGGAQADDGDPFAPWQTGDQQAEKIASGDDGRRAQAEKGGDAGHHAGIEAAQRRVAIQSRELRMAAQSHQVVGVGGDGVGEAGVRCAVQNPIRGRFQRQGGKLEAQEVRGRVGAC